MRAFPLLLVLIVGCATRPAGPAPVRTGILAGVVAVDNQPLAGRRVEAANLSGTTLASTTTDAEGRFSFSLPEGKYGIHALLAEGDVLSSMEEVRAGNLGPLVQLVRRRIRKSIRDYPRGNPLSRAVALAQRRTMPLMSPHRPLLKRTTWQSIRLAPLGQ